MTVRVELQLELKLGIGLELRLGVTSRDLFRVRLRETKDSHRTEGI